MIDKVFNRLIDDITLELEQINDKSEILAIIYDAIKKIVPSDEIHILSVDNENKMAYDIEDNNLSCALDGSGVLCQLYQSHQPLLVNDVSRSLLYNRDIDSLGKENVSKILTIPILQYNSSKNMLGIVWVALKKGYRQFIQEDIDNLVKFINNIKNRIFEMDTDKKDSANHRLLECQEAKRVLETRIARDENYFASTIHDIRTPMNAVIGFMELMLISENDEQKRDYINSTLKSGEQMVSLINDILDMSKVSSGKMTVDKNDFYSLEAFEDIAKLFYNSIIKKSIKFNIYIDPKLPSMIHSDIYRIKQIINNLLSNAMKFTPEEGEVRFEAIYDKLKSTIRIDITDTGIGIAKDKQKSIFNPYTQEENSTSSQYGGTGLGLAISQQLSILLNGNLTVKSKQGEGSTFTLQLPCEKNVSREPAIDKNKLDNTNMLFYSPSMIYPEFDTIKRYFNDMDIGYDYWQSGKGDYSDGHSILFIDVSHAQRQGEKIQSFLDEGGLIIFLGNNFETEDYNFKGNFKILHNPILPNILFDKINQLINPEALGKTQDNKLLNNKSLKGLNALVIDDSRINLKLMSEILKKFELTVKTALNPKEGLATLEEEVFDVIFIDQNMPILNGDEAITIIRENEKKNGTKPALIYGLTGETNDEITDKLLNAGADAIFTKPVHIAEIYEAIAIIKD